MLFEFFRLPRLERDELLRSVEVVGHQNVLDALERGKGVIITSSHIGNWELGAVVLAHLGHQVHAVAGVQLGRWLAPAVRDAKSELAVHTIRPEDGYRKLWRALSRNDLLALMVDGDIFGQGVDLSFFDRECTLAGGTGCSVEANRGAGCQRVLPTRRARKIPRRARADARPGCVRHGQRVELRDRGDHPAADPREHHGSGASSARSGTSRPMPPIRPPRDEARDRRMKIGIVTQSYYPRFGGVTEHVHATATELVRRGHDVRVITARFKEERDAGLRVERIGRNVLIPFNRAYVDYTVGWNLKAQLEGAVPSARVRSDPHALSGGAEPAVARRRGRRVSAGRHVSHDGTQSTAGHLSKRHLRGAWSGSMRASRYRRRRRNAPSIISAEVIA